MDRQTPKLVNDEEIPIDLNDALVRPMNVKRFERHVRQPAEQRSLKQERPKKGYCSKPTSLRRHASSSRRES
jgi:hypothetical protein